MLRHLAKTLNLIIICIMLDSVHLSILRVLIVPSVVDHFQRIYNWNGFFLLLLFISLFLLGLQARIWRWLSEDVFFFWRLNASGLSEEFGNICGHLFLGNESVIRGIHLVEDLVDCEGI